MAERSDRFFMWVWRLNGLLLLAFALVGSAGAIALISDMAGLWSQDRSDQQVTEVAGIELDAEDLHLRNFRPIAGTDFLYAQLDQRGEEFGSLSSGRFGLTHNVLFFNMTTKRAHWLLPDNEEVILWFDFLMDPPDAHCAYTDCQSGERDQVAIAMLVELESQHASADAASQSRSLAIATADGRNLTPIVESSEGLLGHHQPRPGSVLVFYVSDGAARVLDLDVTTRKVRSDALVSAEE